MTEKRNRIIVLSLALTVFTFLFSGCSESKEAKVDRLFREFGGLPNLPSASVIVIKDGEIVFNKAYGCSGVEKNTKAETTTNYRIASLTKQFTAMCIMILKDRGALNYEDKAIDILPDFPEYGREITVWHLLNHTSGLKEYQDVQHYPAGTTKQLKDKDVFDFYKKQDSTNFRPGTACQYSDGGYAVLALIIEKVSGMSFAEFLKQNIFIPLEMNNTVAYEEGISEVKNRAYGSAVENNKFINKDQSLFSAVLGDGGIYTSTVDMYKWDQALYTDKLVSSGTMKEAFAISRTTLGQPVTYGFGWGKEPNKPGQYVMEGSTKGFRSIYYRNEEKRFSVIILTNKDVFNYMYTNKIKRLMRMFM
ncbi:MAG TPA: serine hydrolase domain-containing protein [Bacillota bacterium]|nr:serine hydrolase domain-containing protein [Bacillota bacterium]